MTPNDIEVLLHYYVNPKEHPKKASNAVSGSILKSLREGIFKYVDYVPAPAVGHAGDAAFKVTERGCALIKILQNVEYPILAWLDGKGNIID